MLPTHHLRATIAVVLALSAIAAPTTTARPLTADPPCANCVVDSATGAPASGSSASAPPAIVRVETKTGLDWGDAGIGAAGGIALSMLGLGAALVIRSQRPERTP